MTSKIEDIQALRAIAIILVFAQHISATVPAKALAFLPSRVAFWTGVELFLVISGFVITKALIDRGNFRRWSDADFTAFWRRRFLRLLPASIFWIFVGLAVSVVIGLSPNDLWGNVKGSLMALTATYNLFDGYCTIYLAYGTVCPANSITRIYWSLSLEEQFYLLLSLALLVGHPRKILFVCFLMAMTILVLRWQFPDSYRLAVVHRVSDRSYGLFFGVALGLAYGRYAPYVARVPMIVRSMVMLPGGVGLIFLPALVGAATPFVAACASAVIVAFATADGAISGGRLGRTLVWLGERSYSLYLCHFSVLYLVGWAIKLVSASNPLWETSFSLSVLAVSASFLMSVFAAHLSYEQIEKRYMSPHKVR